jgi:hypothetical protein
MVIQPTLLQNLPFTKSNAKAYQLGFLRFEKEKNGKDYFFSGFSRHALTDYLTYELGYYRIGQDKTYTVVQHNTGIVEEVPIHQAKNDLLEVLSELQNKTEVFEGKTIHIHRDDILDKFHNVQSTYFSPGSIDILKELKKEFLRDDATNAYFFYKNGVVRVSADAQELISYDKVHDKLIWKSWIRDHEIVLEGDGQIAMFEDFISNVSGDDKSKLGFISAIGYLLVNFNLPSKTQAVILYDAKITDLENPAGGTGKGILAKALSQLRKQVVIDGKKFNTQSSFAFQNVSTDTQIIFLDDVKSGMDFKHFYSILSEGLTIEQKSKTSWKFNPGNSPKIIISSNSVFSNKGNSNRRRQFILEFSDFYSSKIYSGTEEPVKDHHGLMFFDDWDIAEWNRFFLFLMHCTREYFNSGLIPVEIKGLNDNLLLQQTSEDFYEWVQEKHFELGTTYLRDDYFIPFQLEYYGESRDFSVKKFNKWMKEFAESKGLEYKSQRSNSVNYFIISDTSRRKKGTNKEQDDELTF